MKSLLLLLILAVTASAGEPERFEFHQPLMGTRFSIVCDHEDAAGAAKAAAEAFAVADAINAVASDYIADSELLSLSDARVGEPVEVSTRLFPILVAARDIAERSDGAYDPTLGPLTRLWRATRKSGELPEPGVLAKSRAACGWRHFTLDPEARTLTLDRPGMRFDLGGIAKGYAADRMLEVMRKHGISRTCIVAGGDVRLGAPPAGRDAWSVGIKTFDPEQPEEILSLHDAAVSTSGDLHQFVEIGGKRYSHILDPATGLGLTRSIAVSVVAPNATLSDALATAACVVGPERAEATARQAGATEVRVRVRVP